MTNIEQEFFKVFNISKTSIDFVCDKNKCNKKRLMGRFACLECDNETKKEIEDYPKITDRVLLELICMANKASIEVVGETVEEMKNKLLEEMIYWKDDIIHKEIQSLFKGEE